MRLLIVGALGGHISTASRMAMARGATVAQVDNIEGALRALRAGQGAELVLVDVVLDIGRFIASLKSERIAVPVAACGLENDAEAAVSAIKSGAREYVPLPPDPELIAAILEAVTEDRHELICRDAGMRRLIQLAEKIAASDASVLVTGESGTGKEVVARHIHRRSRRAGKTFVSVNCAAIPENLLESELFGHEKGAFTGAVSRRIGRFEEADGGTLLLDEVSEMEPRLQAKLLRAIQEREITRVGSNQQTKVDIRLIATTNRDLATEVANGRFREDLYYRLNVFELRLPALRERRDDLPALAKHFIAKYASANGVPALPLSPEALRRLAAHSWRGNVRELENTMHRAVLLAQGDEIGLDAIHLTDLTPLADQRPGSHGAPAGAADQPADARGDVSALVGRTVADVERDLIIDTLGHCLGNRTHAANILGISIRTLRNKIRQYGAQGVRVPMPGEAERASV